MTVLADHAAWLRSGSVSVEDDGGWTYSLVDRAQFVAIADLLDSAQPAQRCKIHDGLSSDPTRLTCDYWLGAYAVGNHPQVCDLVPAVVIPLGDPAVTDGPGAVETVQEDDGE